MNLVPASRQLMAAGREFVDRHGRSISFAARWAPPLALAAWIAATYWYAANSLPLPNIACPQDLGLMLDAGWRYYQGQRPHADYHTPLGPLFAMVFGVPMRLFGPSYSSLQFLPPTLSALSAVWTLLICRRSLSPWLATFTAMGMGAITGGLYHLGFPPEALTFATIYNRIGFGILGIVTLAAMLPRMENEVLTNRLMDCSAAVGILLLAFLKANFAVAAIPFALLCAFGVRRNRRDWVALAVVSGLVLLFFLSQIGFRIDKMWTDLLLASRVRSSGVGLVFYPLRNALANYDLFLLLALHSLLWLPRYESAGSWRRSLFFIGVIWCSTLIGLGLSVVSSHGDGRGISLMLSAVAISTAWLSRRAPDEPPTCTTSTATRLKSDFAAVTTALIAMLFIVPHAQSYLFWREVSEKPGPPQFPPGPLRSLYVGNITNMLGPDCVPKMNEAMELVSTHCTHSDSLQYPGCTNIYSFACDLRPPKDAAIYWDILSTYNLQHHPPASDLWDTDFILMPKRGLAANDTSEEWMAVYGYHVLTHYEVCGETNFYTIYKHKNRRDTNSHAP